MVYTILVIALLVAMFILFFSSFQKRKNKLLLEKIRREREFEEEIVKTKTEIQEQTLKNVGLELHDNIGQLLSVTNMQLSLISSLAQDSIKDKVEDTKAIISDVIKEVRGLSKVLNSEVVLNFGFQESLRTEIERLNKMNTIKAELLSSGDKNSFKNNKDAIILFRILQEFISNAVKYSKATQLTVTLNYEKDNLQIIAEDNGVGFNVENVKKGSGLINMKSRAKLTNTEFNLISTPNQGTKLLLNYPIALRAISQTT
ncbi:histidine kinase [Pontimicrobium aquaticum]|uniref:histidine kinase n=2 Tax=Pontimicrobium aquaticum TaxID=2565367 RepID=A0A4U0ER12_9FLAO|nr:histidine kinase [Pontimicrobium aquaticum]